MTDLILHVKKKWFDETKAGMKTREYRLTTPYWFKRIEGKTFDRVIIIHGYPATRTTENTLIFPWKGYEIVMINHEEFQNRKVQVYAIILEDGL